MAHLFVSRLHGKMSVNNVSCHSFCVFMSLEVGFYRNVVVELMEADKSLSLFKCAYIKGYRNTLTVF